MGVHNPPNTTVTTETPTDFTEGSVVFAGDDGTLQEDSSNLFWDDTNDRLGIGTSSPSSQLSVSSATAATDSNVVEVLDSDSTTIFKISDTAKAELSGGNAPRLTFRAVNTNFGYIALNSTTFDFVNNVGAFRFIGATDLNFVPVYMSLSLGPTVVHTISNYVNNKSLVMKQALYATQTLNMMEIQAKNGTPITVFGPNGELGINQSSPTSMLHAVSSASTKVACIFEGSASQTANLTEWQDSSGTVLAAVRAGGALQLPIETITASSDTLDDTNHTVLCDCTSNSITINLPAASSSNGVIYNIKKIDNSANGVTIDGSGSETIDGVTTQTISTQHESITIQCDGIGWWII